MYLNVKRKHLYIFCFLLLLILLIILLALKTNKTIYGKKILIEGEFNISTYFAEYEMTVISNKNTNTAEIFLNLLILSGLASLYFL